MKLPNEIKWRGGYFDVAALILNNSSTLHRMDLIPGIQVQTHSRIYEKLYIAFIP
jgi:hypothetical protein